MKVLHTADWHLGKMFHGVNLIEDQRHALNQLVEAVESERPDVVLVAGDVYDRAVPPTDAVDLLGEILNRIVGDLETSVVMVAGNHDSASRLHFAGSLLSRAGLHVFGRLDSRTELLSIKCADGETLTICPMPFAEPAQVREFGACEDVKCHDSAQAWWASYYKQRLPKGAVSVAVGHSFVANSKPSDSEKSLTIGGAEQVSVEHYSPFTYTALGHLHRPQACPGNERVRYSGSLLKYSLSEVDYQKGFTIVDISRGGAEVECRQIDIKPLHDVRRVAGTLESVIKMATHGNGPNNDYVYVQLDETVMPVEAVSQVRAHYPNMLEVTVKPREIQNSLDANGALQLQDINDYDLFSTFYKTILGEEMVTGSDLDKALREVLEKMNRGEQS